MDKYKRVNLFLLMDCSLINSFHFTIFMFILIINQIFKLIKNFNYMYAIENNHQSKNLNTIQ